MAKEEAEFRFSEANMYLANLEESQDRLADAEKLIDAQHEALLEMAKECIEAHQELRYYVMSGARSRRKGAVGERELASLLTAEGFPATRGQQFQGSPDSPDVKCPSLPGLHWEVKRTERLSLYEAMFQAMSDAEDKIAVVAHRRNNFGWVAILGLEDFLAIVRESTYVTTEVEK